MLTAGVLAIVGASTFFVWIPVLLGDAVDRALDLLSEGASAGVARAALLRAAAVLLVVSVLRGSFAYAQMFIGQVLGQKLAYELRMEFFEKLQRLSFSFHDRAHTGNLMSRGISDIEGVRMFAQTGLLRVFYLVILLGLSAFLMLRLDWQLGLITLAFVPVVAFRSTLMRLRLRATWLRIQEEMGAVNTRVQENMAGVRVVRSFSGQRYEEAKFEDSSQRVLDLMNTAANVRAGNGSFMTFSLLVAWAVILWFGGNRVLNGSLTVGEFTQFVAFMGLLQMPIRTLPMMINSWARASSAGSRLFEVLDLELPIEDSPNARPLEVTDGVLRFENVSFGYADTPILHNITFEARPGHTIAIVGPPGSGKSTIAQLAPRLYEVGSGRITIDGQDIRDVTLESLRDAVGLVQQDTFLFVDAISANIAYGEPGAAEERIVTSAQAAQVHQHIENMPERYESMVGERGVSLSGGQRQRMAIARALLVKPRILVFDDATSAIDAATERLIRADLAKRAGDTTTVIIAHRLSSVQDADEILVLEEGRITERGTHAELLEQGGRYREMHDLQVRPSDDLTGGWLELSSGDGAGGRA